ncbi:hypothetical protein LX36DRAFT_660599 [Colletotrichum falcatum]|nr:hypothetical protein LX36DRAFT_660599 [Colletotrichum falcatum]
MSAHLANDYLCPFPSAQPPAAPSLFAVPFAYPASLPRFPVEDRVDVALPTEKMPYPALKQKLEVRRLWWNKQLGIRAFLVFRRLLRFYSTFVILAALVSGLAVAALTFPEFHGGSGATQVGEGLLCSSAITAVVSAVMATMLLFTFEGAEQASRLDLAVAWSPLFLLDVSILEFLVGMACWYYGKNVPWRGVLITVELTWLLACCLVLSIWIWVILSRKGGLGFEERQAAAAGQRRAADA